MSDSMSEPVVLSWSGGKDSALTLHALQGGDEYEVVALMTSVAEEYDRVSHHGVRVELLEEQASAVGLPLDKVFLPSRPDGPCTNSVYEEIMHSAVQKYRDAGVRAVAHGDIFLEDLRAYRERNLAKAGMRGVFPLWQRDTGELVRRFIELGFKAYTSCVEGNEGAGLVGRPIDERFLADLPAGADPCGENGEYHSFVYDGPIFKSAVAVSVGRRLVRDGRHYADLLPAGAPGAETVDEGAVPPLA